MSKSEAGQQFDAEYFENQCGPVPYEREHPVWQEHFATAARSIQAAFQPARVLDVGCAKGFLVEQLRALSIEAFGLDISSYAISQVPEEVQPYCNVKDGTSNIGERYDLITCIDVAQHLSETDARRLVRNLCMHADEVLFSAPADAHGDSTCLNAQPKSYWQACFAQNGFYPVLRGGPDYFGPDALHFRKLTRKLRVAVFSREKEEWAVVRLRLLDPLRELERLGRMEWTFVSMHQGAVPIEQLLDADLWVIHREFADRDLSAGLLEAALLLNKPVVFDIDDLITDLPRSNPFWSYCNKVLPAVQETLRRADFVTATSSRLLEGLTEAVPEVAGKGHVLRNLIDTGIWGTGFRPCPARPGEPLIVGWCGSPTHDEDLAIVEEAITYLMRKHRGELEFHFFGYLPESLQGRDGIYLVRGPVGDVGKHARGVRGATIHLAIAPLTDHPFNQCKSDLKWLEYSISCIPGIYSNVTPYAGSIQSGINGLLVENNTAAWVEAIERLIADRELREKIARNAYDTVRATLCVDVAATRYDDLYRSFVVTGPRVQGAELDDEAVRRASGLLFRFQARQQARAGETAGAVVSLEASLSLDPGGLSEVVGAGRRLMADQQYSVAEQIFRAAVREVPHEPEGHLWLSKLYRSLGDVLGAERALAAAARLHPADPDLVSEHVEHLIDQGRTEEIKPRLEALVAAERHPEEAVMVAEMLVRMGRAREARTVIENAAAGFPDVDFSPLQTALARADEAGLVNQVEAHGETGALKVAIYTREPLTSPRVMTRLRSPLRALERAAQVETRFSDGTIDSAIVDWADLVILHRDFSRRDLAEPIVERAHLANKPVVFELDDLPDERQALFGDEQAAAVADDLCWLIARADATTVAGPALMTALCERVPEARERIVLLESAIDPDIWQSCSRWKPAAGRPFQVGLVTDWCRPAEIRGLVGRLAPLIGVKGSEIALSTWSPRTEPGAPLPAAKNAGSASACYLEYAHRLQTSGLDLALVPVSNDLYFTTLPDSIAVELAAARIPAVFSAREPFVHSVIQGQTGLLLGDDPEVWAQMVVRLLSCDRIRRELADRAWNIAFAERTVQPLAAQWGELYQGLVASRRRECQTV